ncbi:subtilisin-like protease SBT1.6 [Juglans microcarpa x Juglans regia]|uniref:subtilisin-like protease SBT1.6 n=1 Tax=Juglans microcarpa x Juglans regia TaxID=2249226 RepID=UPI001B7F1A8D|nr:subtilisin-like protease SBT1.6 [Juglans microcarpa x Juglans regia]
MASDSLLPLLFFISFLFLCSFPPKVPAVSTDQSARTFIFRVDSHSKPSIFPTHYHWYASEFADAPRILHVYDTVFHGFSATLTPDEANSLGQHPSVLAVFEDRRRQLHTTRSPQFLGLRNQRGLWSNSDYGSDVIVGIFDTGIWPERRSFSDKNLGPVPVRWKGACEIGEKFLARSCNRKLIGARFFVKGHEAAGAGSGGVPPITMVNDTVEYRSPRDADGHGTHTASTAAGRYAFQASMAGYASGIAKGVAPKARLAVYKVCWKNSGCFDSDILAAFDKAVADGVDVISISIGGGDGISSPYYLDPIAIGAYGAVSRGVFVSSSAGNDGPNVMSVTNIAPWLMTVGAGTIDRNFPAIVTLGNMRKLYGVSLYAGAQLNGTMYPLVYPGKSGVFSASLCMENSLDPNLVRGKIVICDRGNSPRVAKGLVVKKAGGVGMILANGVYNGEGLVGDAHLLPACAIGADEGELVKKYITSTANPTATIDFQGTLLGIKPAPVVASFSGRGPNGLNPEILKPDLIAPGVNILAAWTDAVGPTGLDTDTRKTEFNILSGTSMAAPHVSGAAALLKSAHHDWSPAAIRSAMMTTASIIDNRNQPMLDESSGKPSTPYDFGTGHLNLDRAIDPGLVYDITNDDYVKFLCSIGYGPKIIQVITRSPASCPAKKPVPENLNYPSMAALFPSSSSVGPSSKTFFRTVTNVGPANAVYVARVEAPKGVTVTVKPSKLAFTTAVRKQSFVVTVTADTRNLVLDDSGAVFGSLSWSDGNHVVRSPIVVTQLNLL